MNPNYTPDESSVGAWAWFILFIWTMAYWIIFDIWANYHNHEYMTTEFREAIANELWGPILLGTVAFAITAFIVHMFSIGLPK